MYFTLDNACTVATCIYINIGKSLYIQMVIHVGFCVIVQEITPIIANITEIFPEHISYLSEILISSDRTFKLFLFLHEND